MDTSAQLIPTVQQLADHLLQLYMQDLDCMYHWWVIFYFPLYVLKWLYIFFPVFLLVGGIYGIRSGSRQNKTR